MTLDAGPGRKVQLRFTSLQLADGDAVYLYEGRSTDGDDYQIARLANTAVPIDPIVSNGQYLHIMMVTNDVTVACTVI